MKSAKEIPEETKYQIIHFFKTESNNTRQKIADHFGTSKGIIDKIIDNYFKELTKKMNNQ